MVEGHRVLDDSYFTRDGDIIKGNIGSNTICHFQRDDLNCSVALYPKLTVRLRGSTTTQYQIDVWDENNFLWSQVEDGASPPTKFEGRTYTLSSLTPSVSTVNKIRFIIKTGDGTGKWVDVDFMAIHRLDPITFNIRHPLQRTRSKDYSLKKKPGTIHEFESLGERAVGWTGSGWVDTIEQRDALKIFMRDGTPFFFSTPYGDTTVTLDIASLQYLRGVVEKFRFSFKLLKHSKVH